MANVLTSCNDSRYKCGAPLPSACVFYTADLPTYVDASLFPCNVNIDDVFTVINTTIQNILTGIDLTAINTQCLTFNPATITVKGLHQIEINQICANTASIAAVQTQLNNLDLATETVSINLQCLTPDTNPCSPGTNTYTLFFILTTLLTQVCSLQAQVTSLQTQVNALT